MTNCKRRRSSNNNFVAQLIRHVKIKSKLACTNGLLYFLQKLITTAIIVIAWFKLKAKMQHTDYGILSWRKFDPIKIWILHTSAKSCICTYAIIANDFRNIEIWLRCIYLTSVLPQTKITWQEVSFRSWFYTRGEQQSEQEWSRSLVFFGYGGQDFDIKQEQEPEFNLCFIFWMQQWFLQLFNRSQTGVWVQYFRQNRSTSQHFRSRSGVGDKKFRLRSPLFYTEKIS